MKDLFLLHSKIEIHNLGISDHRPHFLACHNIPIRFQEGIIDTEQLVTAF